MRYVIIDRQTRAAVSKPYQSLSRARHRADNLDNEYGAYRYMVMPYVEHAAPAAASAAWTPETARQRVGGTWGT